MNGKRFCVAVCLLLTTRIDVAPMKEAQPPDGPVVLLGSANEPNPQRPALPEEHRRPKWTSEAAHQLREWLAQRELTAVQEARLGDMLAAFHEEDQVEQMVAAALTSPQTTRAMRLQLLRALADRRLDGLPKSWLDALGQALADTALTVRREAIATVKAQNLGRFDRRLQALSRQSDLPVELRIAALDCIAARQRQLSAEGFTLLTEHLGEQVGPLERLEAARALGASRLDRQQLLQLAGQLPRLEPTPAMLVLPAFTRSREAAVGLALVEALKRSPAAELMTVGDLDRLLAGYPNEVVTAAKALREQFAARQEGRLALGRLAARLPPGNAGRGQKLFFSERAACSGCHRAAGGGGSVGPNLSRIGFLRGRDELLESIVLPSADIAPEFRAYVVVTESGLIVNGLLARETAEAIFLRTGTSAETRVARKDVEGLTMSKLSLMPEGFDKVLTPQELSDLIEFLVNLR